MLCLKMPPWWRKIPSMMNNYACHDEEGCFPWWISSSLRMMNVFVMRWFVICLVSKLIYVMIILTSCLATRRPLLIILSEYNHHQPSLAKKIFFSYSLTSLEKSLMATEEHLLFFVTFPFLSSLQIPSHSPRAYPVSIS